MYLTLERMRQMGLDTNITAIFDKKIAMYENIKSVVENETTRIVQNFLAQGPFSGPEDMKDKLNEVLKTIKAMKP